jgi:hypothetical protein
MHQLQCNRICVTRGHTHKVPVSVERGKGSPIGVPAPTVGLLGNIERAQITVPYSFFIVSIS